MTRPQTARAAGRQITPRLALAAAGAALAAATAAAVNGLVRGNDRGWVRVNHRGASVSLAAGPALVVAASTTAAIGPLRTHAPGAPALAAAVFLAGLGAGAAGRYDDAVAGQPEQRAAKGFRGHLAAAGQHRVTSGQIKAIAITGCALAAGRLSGPAGGCPNTVHTALAGGLVAASANLLNLLDVRPGRALKAGLLVTGPLAVLGPGSAAALLAGPAGAAAALLPGDLAERTMLGDTGANGLGAVIGLGLSVAVRRPAGRAALLAGLAALTVASEVVSFSVVIDRIPPLRWLDRLGRRPPR